MTASTPGAGAPAVFNLTNVGAGNTCGATQGAIAGYTQQSSTCTAPIAVASGSSVACLFVNHPTAVAGADLALSKTGSGSAIAGQTLTYTLTLLNHGPTTATNVVVTDPVPANTTFVAAAASDPAFVIAAPPTRDTDTPTSMAGRWLDANRSDCKKIWPSVIEMTLVGM